MKRILVFVAAVLAAACEDSTAPIARPENLTYDLLPSGVPKEPLGVILTWSAVPDAALEAYNVYGRLDGAAQFDLRGTTTSTSFHDLGMPDLEYMVTALNTDGEESEPSESVIIDERLVLEAPLGIWSVSLDQAIHLAWEDNAFINAPDGFKTYRVYTTLYNLDDDLCEEGWTLEGTNVAPEFVSATLVNGVPRCFAVSAESIEGWESLWSDRIADTPRPDARNVLLFPVQEDADASGFRFFADLNGDGLASDTELGLVRRGDRADNDFMLDRTGTGAIVIQPVRTGTRVALYGDEPIADLTSIDIAPVAGYSPAGITAEPGFGYVFEMDGGDGFLRFGALRVTHVGTQYIIFDWAYQTDPGNPELSVSGGRTTSSAEGFIVKGRR